MRGLDSILAKYLEGFYVMYDRGGNRFFWDREPWRAIIPLDNEAQRRAVRMLSRIKPPVRVVQDQHTDAVLAALSDDRVKPYSWLRGEVLEIYGTLRANGHLTTIEAVRDGELTGGILAITLGRVFIAETMFSLQPGASKACLCEAVLRYSQSGYEFIDVQQQHPPDHPSARLGERIVALRPFLLQLRRAALAEPRPL
jgi:leucyl/phenylalanyl-tRNA---protein transferase